MESTANDKGSFLCSTIEFSTKKNAEILPDSLLLSGIQFSIVKFTVSIAAYVE